MTETINLWGFIIGIIGIILAIYGLILQHRSNKKKEPVYSIKSNNLISGSVSTLENLNISYKDYMVENLTVSKVLFYNRGAETITEEDIHTKNRPRIIAKDNIKILDISILQTNHESSDFTIPTMPLGYSDLSEGREVMISFKYLDNNHGAVYQVIHTGLSSKDIDIEGDIRGVENLINLGELAEQKGRLEFRLRYVAIFILIIMGFLAYLILVKDALSMITIFLPMWLIGLIIAFIGMYLTITKKTKVPKGLEKFLQ